MKRFLAINTIMLTMLVGDAGNLHGYSLPKPSSRRGNTSVDLQKISQEISKIAQQARKAVVFVSTSKTINMPYGYIDPFDFLFGRDPRRRNPEPQKRQGLGSGFFIDLKRGYIMTNNHVVADVDEIHLKLVNGETYEGRVVGRDKSTDVAVIEVKDKKFARKGLSDLVLSDSDKVQVGDLALALGAPFGLEASLSFGIISAVGRGHLHIADRGNFIQTDAAINPGNSGGPLLNVRGQVIGVNTAIYSKSGGHSGIGFAVPANLARRVAEQLINDGYVERGYLGVHFQYLSPDLRDSMRLPKTLKGVLVSQVVKGAPADNAGIREQDVITAVNNQNIEHLKDLANSIGILKPGVKAKVQVYRGGKTRTVYVTIGKHPDQKRTTTDTKLQTDSYGLELSKVSAKLRNKYDFESRYGLVVTSIVANSPASRSGLKVGDVLLSVNGVKIKSIKTFRKQMRASKRPHLRVEREGQFFYVALRNDK